MMALIKHVDGVDIEMTPEEEAEFLSTLPPDPGPPVPQSITRRQCALQLRALGLITGSEAVAMTRDGTPPATIKAYFNALEDEDRILAEIDFAATSYFRTNPLIGALLAANGMSETDAGAFFIAAAGL